VLELYDFVFAICVLVVGSVVVVYGIKQHNPGKKARSAGNDGVKDMYSVYSDQVKDILKLKDNHIKRLNAELNQYVTEPADNDQNTQVKYDDLKAMAKESGLNPLILEIPFIKTQIKKYTKGMSIEEIISTVKELKGFVGNKKLKPGIEQTEEITPGYF